MLKEFVLSSFRLILLPVASAMASPMMAKLDFLTVLIGGCIYNTAGLPCRGYVPSVADDPSTDRETHHDGQDWTFNILYCHFCIIVLLLATSRVLPLPELRTAGLSSRSFTMDVLFLFR